MPEHAQHPQHPEIDPAVTDLAAKRTASANRFYKTYGIAQPNTPTFSATDTNPRPPKKRSLPGNGNGDTWIHSGLTSIRIRRDPQYRIVFDIFDVVEDRFEYLRTADASLAEADTVARELLRLTDEPR